MPRIVARSLLVAALMLAAPVARAAVAGSVVGLAGTCFVESGGRRSPLQLGAAVQVGDTLDVPAGGKLKLRMTDGSILSLAAGSRMVVSAYTVDAAGKREDAELTLAQGLLRSVTAPVDRPARFEVSTAVGTAVVRSTDWFIETTAGASQVGVLRGAVVLASRATGRSVTVPARWGARVEAGRDPTPARVWSPAEFDAVIARTAVGG